MMSCMVNPDVTSDVMMSVEFNFTDTNKLLRLEMRKGVCQVYLKSVVMLPQNSLKLILHTLSDI